MAVCGCVYFKDECWKEDIHAKAIRSNKAATPSMLVSSQTIQWVAEIRHMKAVTDEDLLPVEGYYSQSMTKNRSKGVVSHPYATSSYWTVGDESRFVGYHMVCSSDVCNKEGSLNVAVVHGCWDGMCWRVLQEYQDLLGKADCLYSLGMML
jgi:hypothetical protein